MTVRIKNCVRERILVLGSSNVDLILKVPRFHHPGETILAEDLVTVFGGKGANQALAAKRLGGKVVFITKLGDDHYGQTYRWFLTKSGLDPKGLLRDKEHPTGMAFIELNRNGENRIIVSAGANGSISEMELRKLRSPWRGISIFVTQLEIPLPAVRTGLQMAKDQRALTLLNPSPPIGVPKDLLSWVDFLVPNELEAALLTGMRMRGKQDIRKMGRRLLEMGAKNVVITLGPQGLFFSDGRQEVRMGAFKVKAIDTTAAGDAFMGALACSLSEKKPIREALRFANAAGALATTRLGAQSSLPSRNEVEDFLSKKAATVLPQR